MTHPEQLPLPLPVREALGREDFFVSSANALAVALVERWEEWPARKMVLCGPKGSGKTHLAHVWARLTGAPIIAAKSLLQADIPALAAAPVCIEDIEAIAGDRPAEEALFHLHNLALAQGHALLLTAGRDPTHWPLVLPDLKSRMMGAQVAHLGAPDDALLTAVMAKLFADRQLMPTPDVLMWLTRNMPRSQAMARAVVAAVDEASLAHRRRVTRALAAEVLAQLTGPSAH
ncbi:DnaA ATPase domain-containing protein [Sagittula salina]|uniref:Chromosomal replication initiator DnaA n=1 Tax=Sagittula salina TaxID=2820268 RepID=A0A940MK69_9RHOB|nr:DnaA/Hda family protein [Sagittula salina]MBP0481108.1 chromosomal replication initiator DnaA [Sagittula salina]